MSEESKVPEIRYEGFSGEWEEREMLDLSSKIGDGLHGTPKYTDDSGIYFINGNNLISGSIIITDETKQVYGKDQSKSDNALGFSSILMSINGTIGNLAWYRGEKVMLGKSVAYITLKDCDNAYMYSYLQTKRIHSYFFNNLTGSTIKNLGLKTIRETIVLVPENKDEQTKIGNYFQQLDTLIAQHQDKHDKLLQIKKSLLEKMFPKQGEAKPEIRFKGFSEPWEVREVTELFEVTRGNVLAATKTSEKQTTETPFPVYSSQTKNNGLMGYYNNFLFENAITWTTDGANAGTVNYRKGKFYSTNVNGVLLSNEGYANKAVSEVLDAVAWKHVSHVGNPKLMNNVMSEIKIAVSKSMGELEQISKILDCFDTLLNQHQSQLKKLKQIKQACLAKMFV